MMIIDLPSGVTIDPHPGIHRTASPQALYIAKIWSQWSDDRRGMFPFPIVHVKPTIRITILSDQTDLNLHTLANSVANVTTATDFIFTINSGVTINASSTATYALRTGTFPAGSTLKIINDGDIRAKGGNGGAGGSYLGGPSTGSAGGHAILLEYACVIDNANGTIFGGGGGGGGGGAAYEGVDPVVNGAAGGGGGGGGAGTSGGTGAAGGTGSTGSGGSGSPVGGTGTSGSATTGGAGGGGGAVNIASFFYSGGTAGTGGAPGAAGTAGASGSGSAGATIQSGAAGGAAGNSINRNGFSLTITAGDNASQIKGAKVG